MTFNFSPVKKSFEERFPITGSLIYGKDGLYYAPVGDILSFIETATKEAYEQGWSDFEHEVTKRMKIAAIIKPKDRTGLLVHIDDTTLSETDVIGLIDVTALKEAREGN